MIIMEVFEGSGIAWRHPDILKRQEWIDNNIAEADVDIWYQGLHSDIRYTEFKNEEDAVAYKLRWTIG